MISILKYLKPYWFFMVMVFVFTLSAILLELYLPTLMADVVDIGIVNHDISFILQTGALMIASALLAIVFNIISIYFSTKAALGLGRDIRRKLFLSVENFSLKEYEKFGPSSLITRTTNDIKQIQDVINMMLRMMTRAPLMLVGGIVLAVSRDAVLSLIFLAALPILAGLIFFISKKALPLFGLLQKKTDRLNLILRETLIGTRVVRAFNRVEYEKSRFNQANRDYRDTGIRVNKIMSFMFPVMMLVMNFTSIAIVWFGAIRIDQGMMQIGNLMAFLQYALMILFSLILLSMVFVMIPRAEASAKRISEVLHVKPEIVDARDELREENGLRGHLEFKNVTFRYSGAEKPAVENISFTAKPGEVTAIIGSTGAGKTTLTQLIPRFYDVESGSILLNRVDIRRMKQHTLRQKIGYVPQKASLFSGTIAENILLGKKDATEVEIFEALETAQALDFVQEKEDGIFAHIEQSGLNLSGGQKQRLSIARALVRKPELYVFDDSFSALDYKTDAKLREALKKKVSDSTILVVAQRVNTVINADQIIVLNEGKTAGVGTHEQLLKENKIYQEIVESQEKEESA
ncbi:multidrug ABC transporter ATP-binding protein [Anaerobacillus alkalidiazotrophicus]|uniref:Multidrug ABC transporter ATP-binding protein n=1 Tax=Anaerobacillus alkalidiazotrophicus TaxID=472963 RepID=A0A1S2M3U4_9BACI|nr:ABC transporter ATP-binding protein [Anaerobacillus alkalidiazotrophicus]OIJ19200.1 multidrug ABC transporter ATP-binding protein [Anaerobacillus alkalidiazotrophicus]